MKSIAGIAIALALLQSAFSSTPPLRGNRHDDQRQLQAEGAAAGEAAGYSAGGKPSKCSYSKPEDKCISPSADCGKATKCYKSGVATVNLSKCFKGTFSWIAVAYTNADGEKVCYKDDDGKLEDIHAKCDTEVQILTHNEDQCHTSLTKAYKAGITLDLCPNAHLYAKEDDSEKVCGYGGDYEFKFKVHCSGAGFPKNDKFCPVVDYKTEPCVKSRQYVNCKCETTYYDANKVCAEAKGICEYDRKCELKEGSTTIYICPKAPKYKPDTFVCDYASTASYKNCEKDSTCTGYDPECPAKKYYQLKDKKVCREADGVCDSPEYCDGKAYCGPDVCLGGPKPKDYRL